VEEKQTVADLVRLDAEAVAKAVLSHRPWSGKEVAGGPRDLLSRAGGSGGTHRAACQQLPHLGITEEQMI